MSPPSLDRQAVEKKNKNLPNIPSTNRKLTCLKLAGSNFVSRLSAPVNISSTLHSLAPFSSNVFLLISGYIYISLKNSNRMSDLKVLGTLLNR